MVFWPKKKESTPAYQKDSYSSNTFENGKLIGKSITTQDGCFFRMNYNPNMGYFSSWVTIPHKSTQHFLEYVWGELVDYPYEPLQRLREELTKYWTDDIEQWKQERKIAQTNPIMLPIQESLSTRQKQPLLPHNSNQNSWEIQIEDPLTQSPTTDNYLEQCQKMFK